MSEVRCYDYIVVGGGSAGCIVAGRLAEEGRKSVLLLEAGEPAEANPETLTGDGFRHAFANDKLLIDRLTEPQAACGGRRIFVGSGRGMGGSGSINGTVYTRGDKGDFAQWPQGWRWEDNLPFFEKLEKRLQIETQAPTKLTEAILSAAEKVGFKRKNRLDDGDLCGFYGYNTLNNTGVRRSSYVAFVKESNSASLEVVTSATFEALVFEGKRATGVRYRHAGQSRVAECRAEVVMCAGALETPKLLMLSGIGPKEELAKFAIAPVAEVAAIGRNFHDHPGVNLMMRTRDDTDFYLPQIYGFDRVNDKTALPAGQPDVCFTAFAGGETMKNAAQRFLPFDLLPRFLQKNGFAKGVVRGAIRLGFAIPAVRSGTDKVFGLIAILGKPQSRGSVTLASADPSKPAAVDPGYYSDPADMETLVNAVQRLFAMGAQDSLQQWGSRPANRKLDPEDREGLAEFIRRSTNTVYHFVGTCSMGEDSTSPVDTELRLRGVENVRIADASAIPVVPVSATNAPTMMLAYRAAQFILDGGLRKEEPRKAAMTD